MPLVEGDSTNGGAKTGLSNGQWFGLAYVIGVLVTLPFTLRGAHGEAAIAGAVGYALGAGVWAVPVVLLLRMLLQRRS